MITKPTDPAFSDTSHDDATCTTSHGLTKREYFAAMAMQGLSGIALQERFDYEDEKIHRVRSITFIPELAVQLADALIAELNR